ncbi:MAG: mechanosensitive ion channel family protein [Chthoniobacterales bacterium]
MKFFYKFIFISFLFFQIAGAPISFGAENNLDTPQLASDAEHGKKDLEKKLDGFSAFTKRAILWVTKDSKFATSVAFQTRAVLEYEIAGFSIERLCFSFLVLLLTLVTRRVFGCYIIAYCIKLARRTKTDLDERFIRALEQPLVTLILIIGLYISIRILPLNDDLASLVSKVFNALIMLVLVWAAVRMTDLISAVLEKRIARRHGAGLAGFAPLVRKTLRIFVLVIGILVTVDNLGYNVTSIIATLGLGTAALALASQDTIKNGFGALMIMLDRPFKVGDWIQVGDKVEGTIEAIGLRSTKVRTFAKTLISIPNGVLANEYINNYTRMPKRRVKQVIGISYEATAKDMEAIVEDVKKLLREDEGVHQEFILVSFTDFGESSLDMLVYYFTSTTVWLDFMDVQQRMNLKIMQAVEARGLSVAFPSRTLYLDGEVANKIAGKNYSSRWDAEAQADNATIAKNTPSKS